MEKTFFIIKPDGVSRGLIGHVLHRIERRGFVIERLEMRQATSELLREHYAALVDKPFFFLADHDGGDQSQGCSARNHSRRLWAGPW